MAKPRKWSNMAGRLPERVVELTPRELAIRAAKDQLAGKSMRELQELWLKMDVVEAQAAAESKKRSIVYAAIERLALDELKAIKEKAGTDQFKSELGTFSPKHNVEPSIEDNDVLTAWAKQNGFEELLTLPSGKLKEIVTEALDEKAAMSLTVPQRAALPPGSAGSMQPPPGIKLYLHTTVSFTGKRATPPDEDE